MSQKHKVAYYVLNNALEDAMAVKTACRITIRGSPVTNKMEYTLMALASMLIF
jgi:hypothetical protein